VASHVCDQIFQELQTLMRVPPTELARPVYVLDGTTLRLAHERELKRAFPPGRNQHGENHWPTLLLVAFHDAYTGLAMRPSWGRCMGPATSVSRGWRVRPCSAYRRMRWRWADSGFGIFWFAYEVQQAQRDGLLRLTVERARKVLHGEVLRPGRRRKVEWEASAQERK